MTKGHFILAALLLSSVAFAAPKPAAKARPKASDAKPGEAIVKTFSHRGTLSGAIGALEKKTKTTIYVDWKALDQNGVTRLSKVNVTAKDISVEAILELMFVQVSKAGKPIASVVYDTRLWVTTQRKAMLLQSGGGLGPAPRGNARPPRRKGALSINFDKTPLVDVVRFFRTKTGANFHINWATLEKTSDITRKTPVTLKVSNVSASTALDLICDSLSGGETDRLSKIYWTVDKGIVLISTGEALDQTMRTKVYDVADLLRLTPNFKGPRVDPDAIGSNSNSTVNASSGGNNNTNKSLFGDDDKDKDRDAKQLTTKQLRERQEKNLIEVVKNSIGEDMWFPTGKGSIKLLGKKLVISQSLLGFELMRRAAK